MATKRSSATVWAAAITASLLSVAGGGWLGYERFRTPSLEQELRDAARAVVVYQRVYGDELNGLRAGALPRDEADLRRGGWTPHERTIVPAGAVQGTPDDWCLMLARSDSDSGADVLRTGDGSHLYDMLAIRGNGGAITALQDRDCSLLLLHSPG